MGFKALTVNTAAEAAGHIYAEDDAAIFQSMFGGDGVLNIGNCLKSTVISNNKVRISDGVLSVGGHIGRLSHADYQDMTIENGATGYNRNDIIYARFLTSGNVDSFILAVKKGTATTGTASDPALVQGNLYEGAVERDYPLYRVKLSGLSIASVDQLFTVIPTIPDLKAQMAKDKAEINQSLTQLNSGSNFKYIEAYKTFVNLKNGESESVKINIDTPGVYLLNFSVCHCGGSSITSNDPSWSVKAPFNFFLARKTLAIPIAKRWDDISGTATFIKYLDKGEYTFNFINETGTSTSDTYYSTVFVSGIMVK